MISVEFVTQNTKLKLGHASQQAVSYRTYPPYVSTAQRLCLNRFRQETFERSICVGQLEELGPKSALCFRGIVMKRSFVEQDCLNAALQKYIW